VEHQETILPGAAGPKGLIGNAGRRYADVLPEMLAQLPASRRRRRQSLKSSPRSATQSWSRADACITPNWSWA